MTDPANTSSGEIPGTPDPAHAARQLKADAEELEEAVEVIPRPFTSYTIIGNLAAAHRSLTESLEELSLWHTQAKDGTHYQDVDGLGDEGTRLAAARLEEAARLAEQLKNVLQEALNESSKVRWLDAPDTGIPNNLGSSAADTSNPA